MSNGVISTITSPMRRSPGGFVIGLSFMGILVIISQSSLSGSHDVPMPVYLSIGFCFLLAISGVFLLFRESRSFQAGESPIDPTQDLSHAVTQLGKNYEVLRSQATQGFILAGTFMALGVFVILAGAIGELFGLTSKGANLTTIAGVVVEAISGIGLYLFRQTFQRLNVTSDRLHDTWKILTAFQQAESLPDDDRAEITKKLITTLAMPSAQLRPGSNSAGV